MNRLLATFGTALVAGTALAAAQDGASVAVQLTQLRRGSLPLTVTAYGSVQVDRAARHSMTAPLAGIVEEVDVRQGQEVSDGAPLLRLDPSPQTAADYAKARAALQVAKQLVQRTRTMLGQHLATQQQLADAEKSQADAAAALAALAAVGAGGPQVLRAPFRAIVDAVSTSPGTIVAPGTALLDLVRPNRLVLEVGVVPQQALAVRQGQAVRIVPLGAIDAVAAAVTLSERAVDPRTGLVPVEIAVPADRFLPGETAQADITVGAATGYVVPHAAILVDHRGAPFVVQAPGMVAKTVPVRILAADGEQDVIAGRLDPAAPLVLAGNHQLHDGLKVRLAGSSGK